MSAVKDSGVGYLDEGDSLTFEIEEGKKGPSAVNLKKEQVKNLTQEARSWVYITIINPKEEKELC